MSNIELDRPKRTSVLDKIIEEEKDQWHFDPLDPTPGYWPCGNIVDKAGKAWDDMVEFARTVDTKVPENSISANVGNSDSDFI